MSAFNVVRFRVKPGRDQDFLDAHTKVEAVWPGMVHANIIKTGDRSYCIIGEWKDMDAWKSEVNIYSPISLTDPSTGAKYYCARTFGGVEVKLKSPPAWESFQVGRLVDVGFRK